MVSVFRSFYCTLSQYYPGYCLWITNIHQKIYLHYPLDIIMINKEIMLLERDEIDNYLSKLDGWKQIGNNHIAKEIEFKDFMEAVTFINKVAEISEKLNHHPDIFLHNYKNVRIETFTHEIDGLSANDFLLAEEIDKINI